MKDDHTSWLSRLDQVKARAALTTDKQLANHLGISPQFLSNVKKGIPFSPQLKVRIMDRLGYQLGRDALLMLLPSDVANLIREIDQQRSIRNADKD